MILNGSADKIPFVKLPKGILGSDTSFTIEMWIKIRDIKTLQNMTVFSFTQAIPFVGNYFNTISFTSNNGLLILMDVYNDQLFDVSSKIKVQNHMSNKEFHIVQTFSSLNVTKLYINGNLTGETYFNALPWLCDDNNYLGFYNDTKRGEISRFNGEINEFRIWEGELSEIEIENNIFLGPGKIYMFFLYY